MNPLVTVVTSTFNHAEYISACVASVCAQSYPHWEQIIVDDGSTDGTWQIAERLAAQHPQVHALHQTHKGPHRLSETYNLALEHAHGGLVAVLEGDDTWPSDKLAIQVAVHERSSDVLMSYGRFMLGLPTGMRPGPEPPFSGSIGTTDFLRYLLLHQAQVLACTQMIQRRALTDIGGFQQDGSPAAVDFATLLHLSRLAGKIVYIPKLLGFWRQHRGQSTDLRGAETAEHNLKLSLDTWRALGPEQQKLLACSPADISRSRQEHIAAAYFNATRNALLVQDRNKSRTCAVKMWQHGGIKRRLQALYAFVAAPIGLDYEPILRWFDQSPPEATTDG